MLNIFTLDRLCLDRRQIVPTFQASEIQEWLVQGGIWRNLDLLLGEGCAWWPCNPLESEQDNEDKNSRPRLGYRLQKEVGRGKGWAVSLLR